MSKHRKRGFSFESFVLGSHLSSHGSRKLDTHLKISTNLSLSDCIAQIGLPIFRSDADKQVYNSPEAKRYRQSL